MALRGRIQARRDGAGRERGAVLVEAAIVTPLMFLLIFALIDYGLYFHEDLSAGNAVRAAAREGIAADADGFADYEILRELDQRLMGVSPDRIVVFKATSFDDDVPADCLNGGVDGLCNSYPAVALGWTQQQFEDSPERQSWDGQDRSVSESEGTDLLGVHVRATHDFAIGVWRDQALISETVIYRIEPKVA